MYRTSLYSLPRLKKKKKKTVQNESRVNADQIV